MLSTIYIYKTSLWSINLNLGSFDKYLYYDKNNKKWLCVRHIKGEAPNGIFFLLAYSVLATVITHTMIHKLDAFNDTMAG